MKVLTASSDNKHNRGDLREEVERKKTREEPREKKKAEENAEGYLQKTASKRAVLQYDMYFTLTHSVVVM